MTKTDQKQLRKTFRIIAEQLRTDSVVKQFLTTTPAANNYRIHVRRFGLSREATVKESLTVASRSVRQARVRL